MIENHQILSITIVLFIQNCFVALQDVAIDGIVCEILPHDLHKWGVLMQTLGQIIGPFLSATIFMELNSAHFCQTWLGTEKEILE